MAVSGEATMAGVPPAGLPKTRSLVSRRNSPAFSASPLWSTRVNNVAPAAWIASVSRCTVSATEYGLRCRMPSVACVPAGVGHWVSFIVRLRSLLVYALVIFPGVTCQHGGQ